MLLWKGRGGIGEHYVLHQMEYHKSVAANRLLRIMNHLSQIVNGRRAAWWILFWNSKRSCDVGYAALFPLHVICRLLAQRNVTCKKRLLPWHCNRQGVCGSVAMVTTNGMFSHFVWGTCAESKMEEIVPEVTGCSKLRDDMIVSSCDLWHRGLWPSY